MFAAIKKWVLHILHKLPSAPPKIAEPAPPCRTGIKLREWKAIHYIGKKTCTMYYVLIVNDEGHFFELRRLEIQKDFWHLRCCRIDHNKQLVRCPRTRHVVTTKQSLHVLPCLLAATCNKKKS